MKILRKIKENFKNVNFLTLLALLCAGVLVAETNAKEATINQSTEKWRPLYDQQNQLTGWQNVNDQQEDVDYSCEQSSNVCTAQFPEGTTPTPSSIPISSVPGDFE